MNSTTRTAITNSDCAEIYATLPQSILCCHGHMVLAAIIDAGRGDTADHTYDTADEIAAYNMGHAAAIAWMNQ